MGKSSKQPTNTTSTVTQTNLPEYAQPYVTDAMQWAQAVSRRPYESYSDPRIAPFSGDQLNAFDMTRQLPNVGMSQYGQAQGLTGLAALQQGASGYTAGQYANPYAAQSYTPTNFQNSDWNATAAQQYMDPYVGQVMDTVLARNQDLFNRDQNSRDAARTRAGAFGGLRQGVEDAVSRQQFGLNQAMTNAQLLSQAYQSGLGAFQQDRARSLETQRLQEGANQFGANFGDQSQRALADFGLQYGRMNEGALQAQAQLGQSQAQGLASIGSQFGALGDQQRQAAQSSIEALRTTGLDQQRQTQASLDQAYTDFVNQRDYEMQMLNFYNSMIRGMPFGSQSNVVQYENQSPYSQALGLGLGAASLYNALSPSSGGTG